MLLILSNHLLTNKAKCLQYFASNNMRIPYTIIAASSTPIDEVLDVLSRIKGEYLNINISFQGTNLFHCINIISDRFNINNELKKLIALANSKKIKNYDLIIQEFLSFDYAGGLLKSDGYILEEYVLGSAGMLFRKGKYYRRILYNYTYKTILFNDGGNQKFIRQFTKGNWIDRPISNDDKKEHDKAKASFPHIPEYFLIEFGVKDGCFYFLEGTEIESGKYKLSGIFDDKKVFVVFHNPDAHTTISMEAPDLSQIDIDEINTEFQLTFLKGAYLSHLPLYAAKKNISCLFEKGEQLNEKI